MKNLVIGMAAMVFVAVGAYSVFAIDTNASTQSLRDNSTTYSNEELGLEFTYRPGPGGYVLEESEPVNNDARLIRAIVLMRTEDAAKDVVLDGEGPATISVFIFENTNALSPQAWAENHLQYSNLDLMMGEMVTDMVDGEEAIRYMADGLYASENVIVAHGDMMYMFTGMYVDENSDLRRDFAPIVESVHFIP